MAWDDAQETFAYWADWPPTHEAVRFIAIGLGIQKMPSRGGSSAFKGAAGDPNGIGAMLAAHPDGIVKV